MKPAVTVESYAHNAPRLKRFLSPPKSLLSRVRWVFLLVGIFMVALALLPIVLASTPWLFKAAALVGLLLLPWRWIRGYVRGTFSPFWDPFEGLAIFAVAITSIDPLAALGLVYGGLSFRSLYGSGRRVLFVLLVYLGAFLLAVPLSLTASGHSPLEVLPHTLGMLLIATILHFLSSTSAKHKRTVFRERTLRQTSVTLMRALDKESIYAAVLDGVQKLAKDMPGTRAAIATGPAEAMTISAALGDHATEVEGIEVNLQNLPDPICAHLLEKRSVEVNNVDPIESAIAQEALSFEPMSGSVYYVPLIIHGELGGLLVVASDSPLPSNLKDSIEVLGSQAALALESVSLAEELHQKQSEARFSSLVRNSSDVITVTEPDGIVRYVSPSVERVLGYKPEDLIGNNRWELVHPDERPELQRLHDEYLKNKSGLTLRVELRMRHRDGSWRYIESIANNLLNDPNVGGLVFNCRDITDRKRAEEEKARHARQVALRAYVSAALAESGTLRSTLQRCAEAMVEHLDASFARIWILNKEESILELQASAGMYTHLDGFHSHVPVGRFKIGLVAQERRPYLTNDVINDPRIHDKEWVRRKGMVAFAGYPLIVEDRLTGVVAMFAREPLGKDTIEALASVADAIAQGVERKRHEDALRKSEVHYRAIVDTASDAIVTMSKEGLIRSFNRAAEDIFGYRSEEIIGQPVRILMPERFQARHEVGFRRYIETGETHVIGKDPVELAGLRKNGEEFPLELSVGEMPEGEDVLCAGIIRDITERKRAAEALRRETAFVQLLQAVAAAANESSTVEYAIQICLDEVCAHTGWPVGHAYLSTGYPAGELIPTTLWYLENPERFETFQKISEATHFGPEVGLPGRVLASGKPAWITNVTEDANFPRAKQAADIGVRAGFAFPVLVGAEVAAVLEFFSTEAVGPDEQLLDVMANVGTQVGRAIERKRAEEALRKSEAHNRAVVNTASDAIITMSEEGLIRSFNHAAEDIFGYSSQEIIGQPLRVLMPKRFRESHEGGFHRYMKTGEAHVTGKGPVELAGLRKSGEEFPLELSIGEMREGEDLLFTGIIRDITERKRAEEEIRRLNQNLERRVAERTAQLESTVADLKRTEESLNAYAARLKQSNRELQNFAHVASHDLQEPLRKVRTFSGRLKTKYAEALGEQGRGYLERMEGAAARMQTLIDDLLALSRVTTQAHPFAPVDLGEVAREVVSDLEARIEQVGGRVEVGELPTIEADRAQMRQLLQNLIGNALKFHKEGEAPIVQVRGKPPEEWNKKQDEGSVDGRICRIVVEDNGIGFEEEHLDRIFVPFQRLHDHVAYEGTGMGLPICRKVVERHGGEITARSAPGQGATFVVTLPIKQTRRNSEQL